MTNMAPTGTEKGSSERKKRFLLLVDGNSADLFATGMLLQRLGYSIFTTSTAEEALQYIEIALPSVLITEMLLPKMNGIELINRIKQAPRTKEVPVIVHTVMKDPKIEELCMVAGCAAYLRKPVDPGTLYRAIQYAMETTPRHYIRLNTCFKVIIGRETAPGPPAIGECITALSENGIFIRTYHPHPVNSLLPVSFFINDRRVNVRAIVLYFFISAGGPLKEPGMGLKFVDITEEDREFIRSYIKEQLTQDMVPPTRPKKA